MCERPSSDLPYQKCCSAPLPTLSLLFPVAKYTKHPFPDLSPQFFTCLVILFACEVAAGIWGFVNKDQVRRPYNLWCGAGRLGWEHSGIPLLLQSQTESQELGFAT